MNEQIHAALCLKITISRKNSIKVKELHFSASQVRHRRLTLTDNKYSWTLKTMTSKIYPLFQHKYMVVAA